MDKLLKLAQKGSRGAFKRLFNYYGPISYGYIIKVTDSQSIAEDVFESVWLEVYREIKNIETPLNIFIIKKIDAELIDLQNVNANGVHYDDRVVTDNAYKQIKENLLNLPDEILYTVLNSYFSHLLLKDADETSLKKSIENDQYILQALSSGVIKSLDKKNISVETLTAEGTLTPYEMVQNLLPDLFEPKLLEENQQSDFLKFVVYRRKKYIVLVSVFTILLCSVIYYYKDRVPVIEHFAASLTSSQEESEIRFVEESQGERLLEGIDINICSQNLETGVLYLEFEIQNLNDSLPEDVYMRVTLSNSSKHSYILKRDYDIFSFPYDVENGELESETLEFSASLISHDSLVISKDFKVNLSDYEEWSRFYELDEKFDTGPTQIHVTSLETRGPFVQLSYKEYSNLVEDFRFYHILIEDDQNNVYEFFEERRSEGRYLLETGAFTDYTSIKTLTVHFLYLHYDDLYTLGEIEDDHLSFDHNNREYSFDIIREDSEVVRFELSTNEVISGGEFPTLKIRENHGWLNLHPGQVSEYSIVTVNDYYNVYGTTDNEVVDVRKMVEYYDQKYKIMLDENHLSYMLQFLPGVNEVEVMSEGYRANRLTYQSYFGETTDQLELAINYGRIELEIMESFIVELEK